MLNKSKIRQVFVGVVVAVIATAVAVLATRALFPSVAASARASTLDRADGAFTSSKSTDVASGFGALNDISLTAAPTTAVDDFQSLHSGNYVDAKTVAPGIYLASGGGALCLWVKDGLGGCTDALNAGDAWLAGDMTREWDAADAPLTVRLYGVARDDVKAVEFGLKNGSVAVVNLKNNAFDLALDDTSFADLTTVALRFVDGSSTRLDPADYYPQHLPDAPPVASDTR